MTNNFKKSLKNIIFGFIPLILFIFIIEIAGRFIYYNYSRNHTFIIQHIYKKLERSYMLYKGDKINKKLQSEYIPLDVLFSNEGDILLNELMDTYEKYFAQLIKEINNVNAKFSILYIPTKYDSANDMIRRICRNYFKDLSNKYNLNFIDITTEFSKYSNEQVFLLPADIHPSRFGNILIADKLKNYLDYHNSYRSKHSFIERPKLLGNLKPNYNDIWAQVETMPYNVTTNSQGLRMNYDLTFPKEKPRVLILGDSFTFGTYLHNHNTYPSLLQNRIESMEIINAGMNGYTIYMELDLFRERAKYIEPDIVILQVIDNDIWGLLTQKKNQFVDDGNYHNLTNNEKILLKAINKDLYDE